MCRLIRVPVVILLSACAPASVGAMMPLAIDHAGDGDLTSGVFRDGAALPNGISAPFRSTNVIVILTDDIGVDKTSAYHEHSSAPPAPTIESLAARGVLFRNAYASPTCSPSRASLLTGRQPTRHGLGRWIYAATETYALPDDEVTIPEMLRLSPQRWSTAAVGKWHMTGFAAENAPNHPNAEGFDYFAGSLANPPESIEEPTGTPGYTNWEKVTNGTAAFTNTYMTVDTVDEAIAQINSLPEPFFLYVALNAAHTPLHVPPRDLLDAPMSSTASDLAKYNAMVEVADDQLARLLDSMSGELTARSTIIYLSDNGSPREVDVIEPPLNPDRGKGTVYEGGVRIPMIIAGPYVAEPGSECNALVHIVDVFPTVAEIASVPLDDFQVTSGPDAGDPINLDGISLLPYLRNADLASLRDVVFSEGFYPNTAGQAFDYRDRTVRDQDWKLIQNERDSITTEQFFRLDPAAVDEGPNLLSAGPLDAEASVAYTALRDHLLTIEEDLSYGP